MNQQWTNKDLVDIVAQLQLNKEPYFMYKRVMFFRANFAENDIVLSYIAQEVAKSGGAMSTTMRRSVFEECAKTDSSRVLQWVLDNTDPGNEYFPVVSILTDILSQPDESIAQFGIAHELGHFVCGHHAADLKIVTQGQQVNLSQYEYTEREFQADTYAIGLMGNSTGAINAMTMLLDWIKRSDLPAQGISPEVIQQSTDIVRLRINAAKQT